MKVELIKNQWIKLPIVHFGNATDGQQATQETIVEMLYNNDHLFVQVQCLQNPYSQQNSYTEHNSDMWNQEVFELFIGTNMENPQHYLEFEINPNNAIWVGTIHNPTGMRHIASDTQMIPYEEAKILHHVRVSEDYWLASFHIPWEIIGAKQESYRFNFYRIISQTPQPEPHWVGTPANCLYLCMFPTMSGQTPAFHRTATFGELWLRE